MTKMVLVSNTSSTPYYPNQTMRTSSRWKNIGGIHYLCPVKIVIATGGFDPLHEGHISYLSAAKRLGDILVVGINSDEWLKRKKGFVFQNYYTRRMIISSLRMVDMVIDFTDTDDSARDAIRATQRWYGIGEDFRYIFANGGDRTPENIPEMDVGDVNFVFGVGGTTKENTSTNTGETYTLGKVRYSMPSDYDRQIDRTHWDKSKHWEMLGPETAQQWEWLISGYISTGPRIRYRIFNNYFQIWPLISTAEVLGFEYVSNDWASSASGTAKTSFTVDTDT